MIDYRGFAEEGTDELELLAQAVAVRKIKFVCSSNFELFDFSNSCYPISSVNTLKIAYGDKNPSVS